MKPAKHILLFLALFAFLTSAHGANIYSEIYTYTWDGKTSNYNGDYCLNWIQWIERFTASGSPLPYAKYKQQMATNPGCGGALNEDHYTWSDVAMTIPGTRYTYVNGVCTSTNAYWGSDYKPKIIREMANYTDKTIYSNNYKYTRYCSANTRFWLTGVTNGQYHFKATLSNTGYWLSWWPGAYQPGDIGSAPTLTPFNYVADGVKIAGFQCDSSGSVTFYWNPYGGGTIDLTPTVTDPNKGKHWYYEVGLTIIP